ncbi:MAG: hypothetical protein ACYTGB_17820 [Planctomycetota bacterium]|jgi:hypothetical protein
MNVLTRAGLAVCLLAAAGDAPAPGDGGPVNGLKLTLTADAAGKCKLTWSNTSREKIVLGRLDCAGCFLGRCMRVRNGKGEVISGLRSHVHFRAPAPVFVTVEPGKSITDEFEAASYMYDQPTGKYDLWIELEQKMMPGGPAGHWVGKVASKAVTINHRKR